MSDRRSRAEFDLTLLPGDPLIEKLYNLERDFAFVDVTVEGREVPCRISGVRVDFTAPDGPLHTFTLRTGA